MQKKSNANPLPIHKSQRWLGWMQLQGFMLEVESWTEYRITEKNENEEVAVVCQKQITTFEI